MDDFKLIDIETEEKYVVTDYIKNISHRASLYLNNGFPVHLRGSAGIGKTSLAFHIAKKIGRPVLFISGGEEINNENLIGGFFGIRKYFVEDNFITSVYKKEELIKKSWNDGRLLSACKDGHTVIYDEFTRTPPNVNNVLLSILEEKVVDVPYGNYNSFVKINPDFRIIFTSNPEEYIGVYKSPNALLDRMITIDMDDIDSETERSIIVAKSGISQEDANKILRLSKYIKNKINNASYSSIRGNIILAKTISTARIKMIPTNPVFRQICKDIYNSVEISFRLMTDKKGELNKIIDEAIDEIFSNK